MGAKQSKRSVDISATPKKGENGNAVNDAIAKIEEGDVEGAVKTVANGVSTHVEKIVEEVTEEVKEEVKTVTEGSYIIRWGRQPQDRSGLRIWRLVVPVPV
ncbi:hypothetical protein M8J77_006782 [Diaphorina citri]|nr:hypothetical protein M8J77_006782 [Diaphorina citri]